MEKQFAPWTFFSWNWKVGGSQREERFDVLVEKALGIDEEELWWYLDTRRFGSAVHSGLDLDLRRSYNWNDEHTRRDSFSKNTIERRVLIFAAKFSLRRINSFTRKAQDTSFFKYFATKKQGAKKSCSYYSNKVIYNFPFCSQWQLRTRTYCWNSCQFGFQSS
jgi:hypothetical protein